MLESAKMLEVTNNFKLEYEEIISNNSGILITTRTGTNPLNFFFTDADVDIFLSKIQHFPFCMRSCLSWNTTLGMPMRIDTTIFDDHYTSFSGADDFCLPFVPDFLLLDEWVCKVSETHIPWHVSRKEVIQSWIEEGKWLNEFRAIKPRPNPPKRKYCELSPEQSAHIKIRMAKAVRPVFNSCLNKCFGNLISPDILHYLQQQVNGI